ncbi:hypothetical protein RL3373 [Rhizobium johnstonii 3841]|uniref:Uncharacterized protein n=1 Tax=Rhizobium johnstonii (strain DSM 114642 / LMG 32736 / 3841) TaxID=216596 RepID=Q1MDW7_RHIJ3|nr:hypothetical protein RL3373 [Rhizobium johnstonii 3841]
MANIVGIEVPVIVEQRKRAAAGNTERLDVFLDQAHMRLAQPFILDQRAVILRIGEDDQHPFPVAKLLERLRKLRLTPGCTDDFMNNRF